MDEVMSGIDFAIPPDDYLNPPATRESLESLLSRLYELKDLMPEVEKSQSIRIGDLEVSDMEECTFITDFNIFNANVGIEIYKDDSEDKVLNNLIVKFILFELYDEEFDITFEVYDFCIKRYCRYMPLPKIENLEDFFEFVANEVPKALEAQKEIRTLSKDVGTDQVSEDTLQKLLHIVNTYIEELSSSI